jgi:serine/threonine protein kinase
MVVQPGIRLGRYQIDVLIGRGGMGEVYRARDTTLDRAVALKTLPESLATDRERLARFEREARLLASLNHPHMSSERYNAETSRRRGREDRDRRNRNGT